MKLCHQNSFLGAWGEELVKVSRKQKRRHRFKKKKKKTGTLSEMKPRVKNKVLGSQTVFMQADIQRSYVGSLVTHTCDVLNSASNRRN